MGGEAADPATEAGKTLDEAGRLVRPDEKVSILKLSKTKLPRRGLSKKHRNHKESTQGPNLEQFGQQNK